MQKEKQYHNNTKTKNSQNIQQTYKEYLKQNIVE